MEHTPNPGGADHDATAAETRPIANEPPPALPQPDSVPTHAATARALTDEQVVVGRAIAMLAAGFAYVFRVEADSRLVCVWASDTVLYITGYTITELEARGGWTLLIAPDDQPLVDQRQARLLAGSAHTVEFRIVTKSGDMRWLRDHAHPEVDPATGQIVRIFGAATDITERKAAEAALRESEERFRLALDALPVMIFNHDRDLRYTWVYNPPPYIVVSKIIGKTDAELLPPKDAASLMALKRQVLESGSGTRANLLLHVGSQARWFDFRAAPQRDATGAIVGLTCAATDITDIKQAEQVRTALLQRLVTAQEDERRRLSRELHDELSQYPAAIQLGIQALRDLQSGDPAWRRHVTQLQELTTALGQNIHTLAYQLRPPTLDDHGLLAALETHIEEWSARYGITANVQCIGLDKRRLPPHLETTIYRVTQEALTNVARHAHAQRVDVIVERRDQHVQLIVEDDGQGFDVDTVLDAADAEHGLGLLGMRERVAVMSGTMTIESFVGRGTTLFVWLPIPTGA